ncbi:MAG: hypothetical protein IJW31_00600 [Lentisphaeria bacterium]|nr:hypothetical protein [Lentisphaeria bacterium]MBR7127337.1 hypothetical protein [Lentisphaeria bacterium]
MTQKEFVIEAMRRNGGYATFRELNQLIDFSSWRTHTPFASVRRIVQENNEFFRIQPGLWALTECRNEVLRRFEIRENNPQSEDIFTHSYYQGIVVEIGNMRNYSTYVPPQDKNKLFLERKLSELTSFERIPDFTYPEILGRAKTVDAIWFNERNMPCAFYEVEHSTDIKNSLNKFYELQDFRANFFIVASSARRNQFNDVISASIYNPIRSIVRFVTYESLISQYENEQNIARVI